MITQRLKLIPILFLVACNSRSTETFKTPSRAEIENIVEAVVYQMPLPVFHKPPRKDKKNSTIQHPKAAFSLDLRKLIIIIPDTSIKTLLPPDVNKVSIYKLLGRPRLIEKQGLKSGDLEYDYLLFQNTVLKKFTVKREFPRAINTTTFKEQNKNPNDKYYYDLTIPIISENGKKAYVEVTLNCTGTCASCTAVYLEKKEQKWKIVRTHEIWTS